MLWHIVNIIFTSSIGTKLGRIRRSLVLLEIIVKEFLKRPNPTILMKLVTIASQHIGSRDFWRISNSIQSSIPPIFNGPEVLTPSSKDKANFFARKLSANSTLYDTLHGIPIFPSWTEQIIFSMRINVRRVANAIC